MKRILLIVAASLFTFASLLAIAAIDTYEFKDEQSREEFKQLTSELRCPKCQNQNLADSNAAIAADMRKEIHRLLEAGQTPQQITDYMVARYGDFVRYRPKQDSTTALLWLSPVVLLAIGVLVLVLVSRRRRSLSKNQVELADTDQERLQRLLSEHEVSEHETDKRQ